MLNHRNIKGLFFVSIILITGLFFFSRKGTEKITTKKTNPELLKVTDLIQSLWTGENIQKYLTDSSFKCPSVKVGNWKQLPEEYYRCHFNFFECALKYEFDTSTELQKLKIKPKFPIKKMSTESSGPFAVLSLLATDYQIKLEPVCDRVVLPAKKYESGVGSEFGSPKKLFNVFNKVAMDRRLFDYGKLREIKKLKPEAFQTIQDKPKKHWYEPVGHLDAKQMRRVCELNGQELMSSEYHDAASFLPKKLEEKHDNEFKAPYIYSHNTNFETAINKDSCKQIQSQDCAAEKFYTQPQYSWIGLSQLHGGLMEYLPSMFHQESSGNVWPSSIHFKANSMFHHLGIRAKWNGVAAERRNLDFSEIKTTEEINIPEIFEIGFRCISVSSL
jgi:hypothetical protein